LQNKFESLEQTTIQTIETVSDGVKNTAEKVQRGIENLSLKHQAEKRPGVVLAASIGAGILTGSWLRRRPSARPVERTVGRSLGRSLFFSAVQTLAPLALEAAVQLIKRRASAEQQAPLAENPEQQPVSE